MEYLLIMGNEDGEPCTFLDDKKLKELLDDPSENYGVRKFLEKIPKEDPAYWKDGNALLLKIEILKPKVVATAFSLQD